MGAIPESNGEQELQVDYYHSTADSYDEWHIESRDKDVALRHILTFADLYSISSVLDLGCETGRGVRDFDEHLPGCRVYGTELSHALLKVGV